MKEEDAMNPRCSDIIDDAQRATREAIDIFDILFNGFENESSLKSAMKNHFQSHLDHLKRVRNSCQKLDHSDDNYQPEMLYHRIQIDNLVGAPLRRSHELDILQSRINQQKNDTIRHEIEFAENLISSIIQHLNIDAKPIVLFTNQAQLLDLKTHFFVTIPFVHFRLYARWWVLGHEIGHLYYNRHKDFDINELLKHLAESIPEDVWSENENKIKNLIYIWIRNWLPEIIADYIALSLFGLFYIIEVRHIESIEFGMGGVSHPPLAFRLSCLGNILKQNEIDPSLIDALNIVREEPTDSFGPILNSLLKNEISLFIANWIINQYSEIEFNWNEIETLPKNSRLSSVFAAICLESYEKDVSEEFDLLRKRLLKDRVD